MPEISGIIQEFLEGNIKTLSGPEPVIQSKTITENGTYTAPSGVDGYSPVIVDVPPTQPVIESKTITENGTYTAPSGVDGYSPVIVDVPPTQPVIQSKTITENGTYTAPSGVDGFSPVVVNVPLPPNVYLLKSAANLPQPIALFNDGADAPMKSLKVAIEPQQEGNGEPSPTNIRPISGWDECKVTVADDLENPTVSNVYTIDLDGTRYGGEVDVVSGVMTVDRGIKLVSNCYWYGSSGGFYTDSVISSIQHGDGRFDHVISSAYKTENVGSITPLSDGGISVDASGYIQLKDMRYSTAVDFKTNMGATQLVYELATPLTIQLTPTAVKSLLGSNNVRADTGDITDAEYFSKDAE